MRNATDPQKNVLRVMAPMNDPSIPMTTAEILTRLERTVRYAPARGSLVGRLRSLERKGMVEVVRHRPPMTWAITHTGRAQVADPGGVPVSVSGGTT